MNTPTAKTPTAGSAADQTMKKVRELEMGFKFHINAYGKATNEEQKNVHLTRCYERIDELMDIRTDLQEQSFGVESDKVKDIIKRLNGQLPCNTKYWINVNFEGAPINKLGVVVLSWNTIYATQRPVDSVSM